MGNQKYEPDSVDSQSHNGSVNYAYDEPIATVSSMYGKAIEPPRSNGTKMNGVRVSKKRTMRFERLISVKSEQSEVESVDEEETRFGWLCVRPGWLQCMNNPIGYCIMLCLVTLMQGMTVFGFVFVGLSTLEKRFYLTSVQSGSISSSYDFSTLIVAVLVSYMGERGHRPLWVGFGSMLFCAGSLIFAIPHFVTPNYVYQETDLSVCGSPNQTNACDDVIDDDATISYYYRFFIIAQVLHGIGASSLYTLGVTYIDENVPTNHFGIYMGVYQAITLTGPALGYIIGGALLRIYTDLNVDPETLTIDASSPLWVGAWWIGFIINAIVLFSFTFIYMGFPKALPGRKKIMEERKFETQKGREFDSDDGAVNQLKALPRAVCTLLTNLPFMFLNGTAVASFFFISGLATFGPKYLESQLSMTPSDAAYAMGIISAGGGITGAIIGGILLNRLRLRFPGLIKLCATCSVLSLLACGVFFIVCPTVDFAGVTVNYENTSELHDGMYALESSCNSRCACTGGYDPVCGSDGVMYYSACHAGCEVSENGDLSTSECQCVHDVTTPSGLGGVVSGTCSTSCPYRAVYFFGFLVIVLLGGMSGVSGWTATIRCVSHSQRAFAMGIQTLIYGLLGSVPGPIVFGYFIDGACLLWDTSCSGTGNCWLYDNAMSARGFLILSGSTQALGAAFLILSLVSYRAPEDETVDEADSNTNAFASQDQLDTVA